MIIESLIIGAFAGAEYSSKIDDKTRKKLSKAFERQYEAKELAEKKKLETDNSMLKLANRKRAILSTSVKDFIELYSRIKKINFVESDGIRELDSNLCLSDGVVELEQLRLKTTHSVAMTDTDLIKSFIIGASLAGLAGAFVTAAFVKDSKRDLKAAEAQMRTAKVVYSQSQTLETVLNGIIDRCNSLSDVLTKLNLLFVKSIRESNEIINKNLYDKSLYTPEDRKVLMTCMNLASAVKGIIDVPVLEENGEITQKSYEALQTGNKYLKQINNLL